MATSAARTAANQANAQKSTGPVTPEGKASSRLNATRHELAGAGGLVLPTDDDAAVAARMDALGRELGASGEVATDLVRRMAVASVRMKRMVAYDSGAVASAMMDARAVFDRERSDDIADQIAQLDGDDFGPAFDRLALIPEGVDHLIAAYRALDEQMTGGDLARAQAARARLVGWLRRSTPSFELTTPAALLDRLDAEVARLHAIRAGMGPQLAAIARERENEAVLASFPTDAAAILARRYEAAATREYFRCLALLRQFRAEQGSTGGAPVDPEPPAPPPPARVDAPRPRTDSPHAARPAPPPEPALGSFRAGVAARPVVRSVAPALSVEPLVTPLIASTSPVERRTNRPEIRQLLQKAH